MPWHLGSRFTVSIKIMCETCSVQCLALKVQYILVFVIAVSWYCSFSDTYIELGCCSAPEIDSMISFSRVYRSYSTNMFLPSPSHWCHHFPPPFACGEHEMAHAGPSRKAERKATCSLYITVLSWMRNPQSILCALQEARTGNIFSEYLPVLSVCSTFYVLFFSSLWGQCSLSSYTGVKWRSRVVKWLT